MPERVNFEGVRGSFMGVYHSVAAGQGKLLHIIQTSIVALPSQTLAESAKLVAGRASWYTSSGPGINVYHDLSILTGGML